MNTTRRWSVVLVFCLLSAKSMAAEPLTIAAAADLRFALAAILTAFQAQQPAEMAIPQVIYGSSGKISSQIQQGAPYDVFFSADHRYTQMLFQAGLTTDPGTVYAHGRIVLYSKVHDVQQLRLTDLTAPQFRYIAIAQPEHAPYGDRAKQALVAAGVWTQLTAKMVYGENIAQAAQMAQTGAADLAIIALALVQQPATTDTAQTKPAVTGNYQLIDASWHQPLLQSYTLTKRGAHNPQAQQLLKFIASPQAQQILQQYGFELPKPPVQP